MENIAKITGGTTFGDVWNFIITFYPINFFGYNVPVLILAFGLSLLLLLVKTSVKAVKNVLIITAIIIVVNIIYQSIH